MHVESCWLVDLLHVTVKAGGSVLYPDRLKSRLVPHLGSCRSLSMACGPFLCCCVSHAVIVWSFYPNVDHLYFSLQFESQWNRMQPWWSGWSIVKASTSSAKYDTKRFPTGDAHHIDRHEHNRKSSVGSLTTRLEDNWKLTLQQLVVGWCVARGS
jgi:hypothetical protein